MKINKIIDYIFISEEIKTMSVLSVSPSDEFLPNENYPSDHVYLRAQLIIPKAKNF